MKKLLVFFLLTLAAIAICFTSCGKKDNNTQNPADTTPEATEEKALPPFAPEGKRPTFLLLGQSNMVGQDKTGLAENLTCEEVKIFRKSAWVDFKEPVFIGFGACLASTFAMDFAAEYGEVGLIPCAVNGASLGKDWIVGADVYKNAVAEAKRAQEKGAEIVGILWMQGEADTNYEPWMRAYYDNFKAMHASLKKELGLPDDIPFIIGEIAPFVKRPYVDVVNGYFRTFSKRDPAIRLASSEGLTDQGDALHFDAKSVRVLGHRFFEQYQILLKERYGVESIDPSKYVEK